MAIINKNNEMCPYCDSSILRYGGDLKSPILIITSYAEDKDIESDMKEGKVLYGKNNVPLYNELDKNGIDLYGCTLASINLHTKTGKSKEAKEAWKHCEEYFMEKLFSVSQNKKFVLCMGSSVTNLFLGYNDITCSGVKLQSKLLSAPIVVGCQTLKYVSTQTHGEFTLAIKNFSKYIKEFKK